MTSSSRRDSTQHITGSEITQFSSFPTDGTLETPEQIRRFELLRLAYFVLKLRKLEKGSAAEQGKEGKIGVKEAADTSLSAEVLGEQELHRSLLRHVIFQQVLTLIKLDAREQALQIIGACQQ